MSSSSSPTDNNTGATGIEEEIHQQVASAAAISISHNEEGAAEGVAATTLQYWNKLAAGPTDRLQVLVRITRLIIVCYLQ